MNSSQENPHRSLLDLTNRMRRMLAQDPNPEEKKSIARKKCDALLRSLIRYFDELDGSFHKRYGESVYEDEPTFEKIVRPMTERACERALEEFDFQRQERLMHVLDWKWIDYSTEKPCMRVPTANRMKNAVEDLLERAKLNFYSTGRAECCTGGFFVGIDVEQGEVRAYVTFVIDNERPMSDPGREQD